MKCNVSRDSVSSSLVQKMMAPEKMDGYFLQNKWYCNNPNTPSKYFDRIFSVQALNDTENSVEIFAAVLFVLKWHSALLSVYIMFPVYLLILYFSTVKKLNVVIFRHHKNSPNLDFKLVKTICNWSIAFLVKLLHSLILKNLINGFHSFPR